ncbi:helix-turn-helix domain-containing protein [Promicromonospora thailandica]|uniref:Helix-turn-helix domain-containing protein n=1 Tax=Promicromonospora thailandica TaxID=765201 RepID=A0A9X2JTS4_9MICO|nr:helix-turn-helix domain-containing protein [Promicromonospora thailandica]MCP2262697.1 Helix-turn-helix domain-containing protein [Promicromonospora thailandica]
MDELGTALRTWRDRIAPGDVGLPHLSPRRVAGLRRSELAQLAGISVEYVVRLEQGRASTPSAQVCAALARALGLSDDEQSHLFRLAGHATTPDRVPRLIPGSVHRIVEQLAGSPVLVCDAGWQMLAWNPLFAAALGDPTRQPAEDRNAMLFQFEQQPSRIRQTTDERDAFERSLVADLRATTSRYPKDPDLRALVARLLRGDRFRELWEQRAVGEHQGARKVVEHPEVGDIAVESNVLTTQGSDLRLVVDTPRDAESRSRLALVATVGLQDMAVRSD